MLVDKPLSLDGFLVRYAFDLDFFSLFSVEANYLAQFRGQLSRCLHPCYVHQHNSNCDQVIRSEIIEAINNSL